LEDTFVDRFKDTAGMALVACSAQNIDRVVTVYRAAKRTARTLIVDAYAAEVLKATGQDGIPKPVAGWSNLAVFIPKSQRVQLVKNNIAALVDSYRGFRLWPEQLAEHAPRSVMLFRGWMMRDLDQAKALTGARVFWSQWDGYLSEGSAGAALKADCERRGITFGFVQTSGHASPGDLKRLASAVAPKRLIPIHTFEREIFPSIFHNVILVDDEQWIVDRSSISAQQ
jgi:ribonuclease J